jgi:CubicO group peptidase (beta-lactamase class C family)
MKLFYIMKKIFLLSLLVVSLFSCSSDSPAEEQMYFPPIDGSTTWETKSIADLGWNQSAVQPLLDYLELKNSKSFIILVNGRIVMENYFNGHSTTTPWYWASAGKSMTSFMAGIAQQDGYLNINNKVSDYLGTGWTSLPIAKENLITVKNQLTMTSGLDDGVADDDCTLPSCLLYKADAGNRWAYHNAAYTLLHKVIGKAIPTSYNEDVNSYFTEKIKSKIGMNGSWITGTGSPYNIVYWSNSRSMARFGLWTLNKGKWNGQQILNENYFDQATTTSQNINLSYGFLWWLNGKGSCMVPTLQTVFPIDLIPNAPADMFCGLGKDDQKVYVIPSKKMVVIRMGNAADASSPALTAFDNELWTKINALYQ